MTDLHAVASEYLTIRRALGFKLRGHDRLLAEFIAFLADTGAPTITTAAAVAWATRPTGVQAVRYAQRLCVVRGFAGYLHALDAAAEVPPSFFVSTRGTRLIYHCVHTTFAQLLTRAGITAPAGTRAPTIHGLRHSFAVATLRDWYLAGVDVAAKLPALSAYMGHAHPASTYWYLSAAPDLLALAAQRLEQAQGGERR